MGFLKNIVGAFVEFKDEEKQESAKTSVPTEKKSPANNASASPVNTAAQSYTQIPGSASNYQKHFEDLIEEANAKNPLFQGTDFKEFIESKADVEAIIDEGSRYRTAFNVLKRTGLTKEKLVSTGKEYLKIIEKDLKGFEDAFLQQYKNDVEQKEQLLQKKAEELQALNEKISALNQQMKQVSTEIIQSKERLNANKNSFIQAGENKKNEILTELQKIEQYF